MAAHPFDFKTSVEICTEFLNRTVRPPFQTPLSGIDVLNLVKSYCGVMQSLFLTIPISLSTFAWPIFESCHCPVAQEKQSNGKIPKIISNADVGAVSKGLLPTIPISLSIFAWPIFESYHCPVTLEERTSGKIPKTISSSDVGAVHKRQLIRQTSAVAVLVSN